MIYGRLPEMNRESTKDSESANFTTALQDSERTFKAPVDDLVYQLLQVNPEARLGNQKGDIELIKKHSFFAGIDWDLILSKEVEVPFVPDLAHDHDTSYFDRKLTSLTFDQDI